MVFNPPFPAYDPTDKTSYETVIRRWPVIVTSIVDHLHNICNDLTIDVDNEANRTKLEEGKGIIAKISELKYHMGRDHILDRPISEDGDPLRDLYNVELERLKEDGKGTWFTAPWLYAEYRLIRSFFSQTKYWNQHDPFFAQKMKTFKQSGNSILQIATTMHEIEIGKHSLDEDPKKLGILFREMIQMDLWGNATDLSLLTHLSAADIDHLQAVGRDAQAARQSFILRDDQDKAWEHVSSLKRGRVDFILDNVFADFLVTFTPFVEKVVFQYVPCPLHHSFSPTHAERSPKLIPWFVSDVTPPDFLATFASLRSARAFFEIDGSSESESVEHLDRMVSRWQKYLDDGTFSLSVPLDRAFGDANSNQAQDAAFWTSPHPYWDIQTRTPGLYESLKTSDLVIFKVSLSLTGDIKWPAWTDFAQALGPLAGSFPLLSLRTNKADVVVGVDRQVAERLDQSGEKWRVSGR
ncbi:DUF89 domain-containing protein [Amanita rubescens]|nr:DUF89 domain-containing protein [Amanita rubescens]